MDNEERIAQLERQIQELHKLIEEIAFGVVNHTTNIDRQINEKLESIRKNA
ncbi:hypothetical protein ACSG7X_000437 [Vibrio fluvialis]